MGYIEKYTDESFHNVGVKRFIAEDNIKLRFYQLITIFEIQVNIDWRKFYWKKKEQLFYVCTYFFVKINNIDLNEDNYKLFVQNHQ